MVLRKKRGFQNVKLIKKITDRDILGLAGISTQQPRITARAILKNNRDMYAVMHSVPPCFREAGGLRYSALCLLAYMMTLAWYPLFFSFWHSLLAAAGVGCGVVIHMYLL